MVDKSQQVSGLATARKLILDLTEDIPVIASRPCYAQGTKVIYDLHFPCEMGIVLSGCFRRIERDREYVLERGMFWWHGSWEPHGWSAEKRSTALVFVFLPSLLHCFSGLHLPPYLPFIRPDIRPTLQPRDIGSKKDMIKRSNSFFSQIQAMKPGWRDVAALDLARIVSESLRGMKLLATGSQFLCESDADRILAASEYIHVNLAEKLTLARVAQAHGMGRTRFAQMFQRVMGRTFGVYVINSRLERARRDIIR